MKLLVFICIILCIPTVAFGGIYESLNPSVLMECRDSLRVLQHDVDYGQNAKALLREIPAYNELLKSSVELIPSPMFEIDLAVHDSILQNDYFKKIKKRLAKEKFQVVASDRTTLFDSLSYKVEPYLRLTVFEQPCLAIIDQMTEDADSRIAYIRSLIIKVNTEMSLIRVGKAMKKYRKEEQSFIWWVRGILVCNDYIDVDHFKKITGLFSVHFRIIE